MTSERLHLDSFLSLFNHGKWYLKNEELKKNNTFFVESDLMTGRNPIFGLIWRSSWILLNVLKRSFCKSHYVKSIFDENFQIKKFLIIITGLTLNISEFIPYKLYVKIREVIRENT